MPEYIEILFIQETICDSLVQRRESSNTRGRYAESLIILILQDVWKGLALAVGLELHNYGPEMPRGLVSSV